MSMAIKYNMQKKAKGGSVGNGCAAGCDCAKCMAKGGKVKGVHPNPPFHDSDLDRHGNKGNSFAGDAVRAANFKPKMAAEHKSMAKGQHHKVLAEMGEMRGKDRKYLAEGGMVGSQHDDYDVKGVHKSGSVGNGCAAGCDCAKCMAKGGEVKGVHQNYIENPWEGKESPRTKKRWAGKSEAGAAARNDDSHEAFAKHGKVIAEMRGMKSKDRKYLAEGGLVDSVMKSRGGEIANDDTAENPKAEENQFDELVETGGLESHIDADQQQGNDQEDQDRRDIVSMVMNTRKKRG